MPRTPQSPDPEPRRQSKVADAFDRFLAEQEAERAFHHKMKSQLAGLLGAAEKDEGQ